MVWQSTIQEKALVQLSTQRYKWWYLTCQDFGVSLTIIVSMKSAHGWEFASPWAHTKHRDPLFVLAGEELTEGAPSPAQSRVNYKLKPGFFPARVWNPQGFHTIWGFTIFQEACPRVWLPSKWEVFWFFSIQSICQKSICFNFQLRQMCSFSKTSLRKQVRV